eukprot:311071_1
MAQEKCHSMSHQLITGCYGQNKEICEQCIKSINQSLRTGDMSIYKDVVNCIINSNAIEGFVKQLKNNEHSAVILDILTNICANSQPYVVEHVVNQNVIPLLIELMSSST